MSTDNNNHGLEEQRRRKAENFKLNIRDNYDDDGTSYGSSEPEEISSYSGEDLKFFRQSSSIPVSYLRFFSSDL